jgi:hypothetical protein
VHLGLELGAQELLRRPRRLQLLGVAGGGVAERGLGGVVCD